MIQSNNLSANNDGASGGVQNFGFTSQQKQTPNQMNNNNAIANFNNINHMPGMQELKGA